MVFSSSIFLFLFLPCVLFGYYVLFARSRKLQNIFLLIFSLIFYAWGEPSFVLIMIVSIIVNWWFGIIIDKNRDNKFRARSIIIIMISFNLIIMFIFKYLMFTLKTINSIFGANIDVPKIALPIGISFFTFQAISYVIDVYKQHGKVQKNPLNVGLYIAFFPQLIAGPIVRYETIADQIINRKESIEGFAYGIKRFIIGMGKKVIIANNLAMVAEKSFKMNGNLSVSMAWLGAIAYTFQILYDFSGYSDMAIGLGEMFGFKFLENFNYPYISKSISEFWRRWHISLGSWFRDYVYFPLGGSRVNTKTRLVFNLFVVWLLTGIWHGANWTFIVWGLMYFILIAIEKLTKLDKNIGWIGHIYTLFFVILGWVIFNSNSITSAFTYIGVMFGKSSVGIIDGIARLYIHDYFIYFVLGTIFAIPLFDSIKRKIKGTRVEMILEIIILGLIILISTLCIVGNSYNPFIYFNF